MCKRTYILLLLISFMALGCGQAMQESTSDFERIPVVKSMIIDHSCTSLAVITDAMIAQATANLHIAYQHTSHGSQLTDGITGLVVSFNAGGGGTKFAYNTGGTGGALDLHDYAMSGDLGNPDRTTWEALTRTYLNSHPTVNVMMWSWCGQVSTATTADIETYLSLMAGLEEDYPNVKFVYMTGHLDGTGLTGNLHIRNEQIRTYCRDNNKILYDFEDIESYDPDGVYYGDKFVNDACAYDSDNNGTLDANWAQAWQSAHTLGVDWYSCTAQHSEALNGNRKAYAAWWLFARLAGWSGN